MKKQNIENFGTNRIVEAGKNLDLTIHSYIIERDDAYKIPLGYLSILSSLTWPGHAKDLNPFYTHGEKYLSSGDKNELELAVENAGRFGKDALNNTLRSWYVLIQESGFAEYDFKTLSVTEYYNVQRKVFDCLKKLIKDKKISGIGEWFLYAPFKIFLEYRKDLWNDKQIDKVKMPIGGGVCKAIQKLIKNKNKYVSSYHSSDFKVENSRIMDNFSTAEMVHSISLQIANDLDTRVLHVNSGLFQLGEGEI